jgi:hypothetical protein
MSKLKPKPKLMPKPELKQKPKQKLKKKRKKQLKQEQNEMLKKMLSGRNVQKTVPPDQQKDHQQIKKILR